MSKQVSEQKGAAEAPYLDPRALRIYRAPFGDLCLTLAGREYQSIRPVQAFPLTGRGSNIAFLDSEGKEIGILADLRSLDAESRQVLADALTMAYFMPRVRAILNVQSRYGISTWTLETDRGRAIAQVKDRSDIRTLADGRIILSDVHGIKYEIRDLGALDERSRSYLDSET